MAKLLADYLTWILFDDPLRIAAVGLMAALFFGTLERSPP